MGDGVVAYAPYMPKITILFAVYLTTLSVALLKQITIFFDNKILKKAYRMPHKACPAYHGMRPAGAKHNNHIG